MQFVGCLASRVNNPPTSSLYKEFALNDFYSGWGEDLQFVGCLANRVNNLPLLLFTKSLHEMIFTVVGEKICNLLAVLPTGLTIPPTSSLYKDFA